MPLDTSCNSTTSCAVQEVFPTRTRDTSRGIITQSVTVGALETLRIYSLSFRFGYSEGNSVAYIRMTGHLGSQYFSLNYEPTISGPGPVPTIYSHIGPDDPRKVWTMRGLEAECLDFVKTELTTRFGLPTSIPVNDTSITVYHTDVMTDVEVPNFYRRQQDGEVFINPMEKNTVDLTCSAPNLSVASAFSWDRVIASGTIASFVEQISDKPSAQCGITFYYDGTVDVRHPLLFRRNVVDAIIGIESKIQPDNLAQKALSDAYASLDSADIDALVSAAEGPETIRYIYMNLLRAADIVKSIKSGTWRRYAPKAWKKYKRLTPHGRVEALAQVLGDIHLELRYALRPIVYDIQGALEALASDHAGSGRLTHRGKRLFETDEFLDQHLVDGIYVSGSLIRTWSARAGILSEVSQAAINQKMFGVGNLGTVAWEVISYSFIVGWLLNVSQLLHTLNSQTGFQELGTWVVEEDHAYLQGFIHVGSAAGAPERLAFSLVRSHKARTPSPKKSFVHVDVNFDFLKLIDLIAIFGRK